MGGMILPKRHGERSGSGLFGADPLRRTGLVRQPSLLGLLSLSDWRRFVPETFILLFAIQFLRGMMDAGSVAAASMPHAFAIPVVLMAAHYGIMGGLFAALSASVLFLVTELPAQSAAQDFYDYAAFAAAQPCVWLAAALVLGGLRTLHIHHRAQIEEQLDGLKATAEELAEQLAEAARQMALIEQRIASDTATTVVLIDLFAKVDISSRQSLLASFAEIFHYCAGAASFAVYLHDGGRFVPYFGLESGSPIPDSALASLPLPPDASTAGGMPDARAPHLPLWIPVRVSETAEPTGFFACTRLASDQTPIVAARRLNEVCRVLAKLLAACPAASFEADRA